MSETPPQQPQPPWPSPSSPPSGSQPPPPSGYPPPGYQPPAPGYPPGASAAGPPSAPSQPNPLAGLERQPARLMALALVAAGALVLLAVLIAIATADADFIDLTFLNRIQVGASLLDLPFLFLVPLALLLNRTGGDDRQGGPGRLVVLGCTGLGAAFVFFLLLRLIGNLSGEEFLVPTQSKGAAFFYDAAHLLVAAAGTYWAFTELQRMSRPTT